MLKNRYYWADPAERLQVVNLLRGKNILIATSDTVLGLLAPLTESSVSLLNEIKGRQNKPYIILIENKSKLSLFVDPQDISLVECLVTHCWPGPLTLIFKACAGLPAWLQGADGTIAVRVPNHAGLLSTLAHFDGLFSTSANLSGQPVPTTIEQVDVSIVSRITGIVLESEGEPESSTLLPSTILDCTGSEPRMVREGAFSRVQLEALCGIHIR